MKKSIAIILIVAAGIAAAVSSCGRRQQLSPFRWESTNNVEADSLTEVLDRMFYNRVAPEKLWPLVARINAIAAGVPDDRLLKARAAYFDNFYQMRTGSCEDATGNLRKAQAEIDSADYPYTYNRLDYLADDSDDRTPEAYRRIAARVDFFERAGDEFMTGVCLMELGNFVKDCNDPTAAVRLYQRADSLFSKTGFENVARGNRMNMANALIIAQDTVKAVGIYRSLLADPEVQSNTMLRDKVLLNLGANTNDRDALDTLYGLYGDSCESRVLTYLTQMLTTDGRADSAVVLGRKALANALDEEDGDAIALAMYSLGDAFAQADRLDSAYIYMNTAMELKDELLLAHRPEEMKETETLREITREKMEAELARSKKMLWVAFWGFVVFLILVVAAWIVNRRIQKMKVARISTQLEMEKMQRRLLATQVTVEEKDALLNSVSKEMSTLKASGAISPEASGRLGSSIKAYMGVSPGRDNFIEAFAELHPDFARKLRERYPLVKDYDVKLAALIAIGLDNKQIASTLGIRHESVKQARWRLRSRMELVPGESLEHALSEFTQKL